MTTPVRPRPTRPLSVQGQVIAAVVTLLYISYTNGAAIDVDFKPVPIDDLKAATRIQYDHLRRVAVTAQCSKPRVKVIHMKDVITDPGSRFIPECTTLHVCAEDTGCCPAGYTCAPASSEKVTLVFQRFKLNPNGAPKITTEAFEFTNHTQCGCVEKNDIPK